MASNPIPICPRCKHADQVQKITQVYDANTEEWSEEELGMDVFGHIEDRKIQHEAHTKLGLKLKPPEEPTPPSHPGLWYGIGIFIAIIVLSGLCPVVIVPLAIVIPIVLSNSSSLPEVFRGQNGTTLPVVIGSAILSCGLIILGLLAWIAYMIKHRFDRDMANYRDKKETYERDQLEPYQRAKERWEQLYYCMRDDIVFIPAENRAVPIEDIEKYLHDPSYKFSE